MLLQKITLLLEEKGYLRHRSGKLEPADLDTALNKFFKDMIDKGNQEVAARRAEEETLTEAFNIHPSSEEEIENPKLKELYNLLMSFGLSEHPISLDKTKPNVVKIKKIFAHKSKKEAKQARAALTQLTGEDFEALKNKEIKKIVWNGLTLVYGDGSPIKSKGGKSSSDKKRDTFLRDQSKRLLYTWLITKESANQEEDPVDTITMDVPLFIRILEYSREDAQTDMDLHDLAEKAIAGTKQQGILSMDDYDMLTGEQEQLTEASVPSNIREFAKRKGVSSLVNKVAGWAERVGKRITGGTAVGRDYDTLVLDMGYQTSDIRIDCDEETVELYGEPVNSFADFKRVFEANSSRVEENMSLDDEAKAYFLAKVKAGEIDTLPEDPKAAFLAQMTKDQMAHDEETLRRERNLQEKIREVAETIKLGQNLNESTLCKRGQDYIKARKAAGEKSSAYLSGRAVKVCKGQIEWPKKGKKNESLNEAENVEDEMLAAMKKVATSLEKANDNVKQSPKDKKVEEGVITLGATIVGAPGLMSALGKGANYLGKAFGKDKTKVGEFLKKKGHQLEEFYIKSLGGWIKAAFPNKYKGQDITDKNSELHEAAQKAYAAMLTLAAVGAGYEAGAAANVVKAGLEGGMAVLKTKEVADIVSKLV